MGKTLRSDWQLKGGGGRKIKRERDRRRGKRVEQEWRDRKGKSQRE